MSAKNIGLGRGLEAIFDIEKSSIPEKNKKKAIFEELKVGEIVANPNQPRRSFDDEALKELSESIAVLGVIQPITVKRQTDGKYMIISGERRFRASQMAGLEVIPAYIREVDDQTLLEMALVENIQRQDLNAVDIAISFQRLIDECSLTQDSLAERVGKKRSTVTNYMRLLKLPAEVQFAIREELISMGHARALAGLNNEEQQVALLKKIVKNGFSVRQTEDTVQKLNTPSTKKNVTEEEYPEGYIRLVEHLEKIFDSDISVKRSGDGRGKITINFNGDSDIEKFLEKLKNIQ